MVPQVIVVAQAVEPEAQVVLLVVELVEALLERVMAQALAVLVELEAQVVALAPWVMIEVPVVQGVPAQAVEPDQELVERVEALLVQAWAAQELCVELQVTQQVAQET